MDVILEFFKSIDWSTISAIVVIFGLIIWAVIKHFSKPFIKSLGEETAKLVTTKQKTQIEESVKKGFNEALEKYKSDLHKEEIDYKIRLETFYSKRTEILLKLSSLLTDYYNSASKMVIFDEQKDDLNNIDENIKKEEAHFDESYNNLNSYYDKNRLFLSKELAQNIASFYNNINTQISKFKELVGNKDAIDSEALKIFHNDMFSFSFASTSTSIQKLEDYNKFIKEGQDGIKVKLSEISSNIRIEQKKNLESLNNSFIELIQPLKGSATDTSIDKDGTKETLS